MTLVLPENEFAKIAIACDENTLLSIGKSKNVKIR